MRLSMDATLKMSVKERMEYVYANGLNSIPAEEAEALLKRADFDYWRTKK